MTPGPVGLGEGRYDSKELLRREFTPELYGEVRALWKAHSLAEDQRDIPTPNSSAPSPTSTSPCGTS